MQRTAICVVTFVKRLSALLVMMSFCSSRALMGAQRGRPGATMLTASGMSARSELALQKAQAGQKAKKAQSDAHKRKRAVLASSSDEEIETDSDSDSSSNSRSSSSSSSDSGSSSDSSDDSSSPEDEPKFKRLPSGRFKCLWKGCRQDYATDDGARRHIDSFHRNIKRFVCDNKGLKACLDHSFIKQHREWLRKRLCGLDTVDRSQLKRHILTHLASKDTYQFRCSVFGCGKGCIDSIAVRKHYKKAHPGIALPKQHEPKSRSNKAKQQKTR